ncbi:eukaryotic translation initiation factor 3 subunit G-A [Eutrema salsugineum]|uniref:eukaryotic translation initiation factor 3 subunit G-A n=1 Tax=Eutrema salsugineum TaxID=72664 RepID=UPI000CECE569|nr:eukaryotic translation initiation factor 3 subunit G-A [Eutrema salsugineum]
MEKTNKVMWGEIEDDENFDYLLPAKQMIGPDENGIKKVIEYRFNDEGKTVKVITTTRVRKGKAGDKRVVERRTSWTKFGDAVHDVAGGGGFTTVSKEDILLERPKSPGTKPEETKASQELVKPGAVLMICRNCGKKGEHWTARCPTNNHSSTTDHAEASTRTGTDHHKADSYVPPNKRGSITVPDPRKRNDENSVRVSNLSEDTREEDLMDLFGTFGAVARAYVAFDKMTGTSRGFGFVDFVNREDAQLAINKLNGYGYDHLILRVAWATPRAN